MFRDRDGATPAREIELLDAEAQRTYRGVVTDAEFERFLKGPAQPVR